MPQIEKQDDDHTPAFLRRPNDSSASFRPDADDARRPPSTQRPPARTESNVTGTVKFFSQDKGIGFLKFADGSPDAFLHASVLAAVGRVTVLPETLVTCDIGYDGGGRRRVVAIRDLDERQVSQAARQQYDQQRQRAIQAAQSKGERRVLRVKKFDALRGFGFFSNPGGLDVFVHISVVQQAGLREISVGDDYEIDIVPGEKGLVATWIRATA